LNELREAVERLTGVATTEASPLGGSVYRVALDNGESVAVKRYGKANEVRAEACSLRWLAEPGAIKVPRVHAFDERWLITDFVPAGSPTPAAAGALGDQLAALHAAGAPAFGSPPDGGPSEATIGMAVMRNVECVEWSEFYATHRIEPYLKEAIDRGTLRSSEGAVFEEVMRRIDDLAGPPEPPARLHGDLWSGNVRWGADGGAWLIDPAAHGGHRETDLAMLQLFGCPHLSTVLEAYQEQSPLAEGWRSRVPLHQLFPLLVHTVLFGGSYAGQAVAAAREALRAG
jgi:fructosamine-3-kinase